MMRRLLPIVALVAAGCLGPRADPSAFFLLTATAGPGGIRAPLAVTLGLGPVTLPGYLDRSELVTRVSENQLVVSEVERWAEPLRDNVLRAVSENLVHLLQPDDYVTYPWYESAQVDYGVAVAITRFEADSTGAVTLEADWRITSGDPQETLYRGESLIQENANGAATDQSVAALSRALARLCDEIAAEVRRIQAASSPRPYSVVIEAHP